MWKETLDKWDVSMHFSRKIMVFHKNKKKVDLEMLAGFHNLIKLEKVEEWNKEDSFYYISKEKKILIQYRV